ncbi:MAG: hypothetical protein JWO03_2954 [Bacteroidetes bacterium]|nr:hypothetical protein [Bacteroidota bacterium]
MKKVSGILALCLFCFFASAQNLNLYPDSLHAPFIYGVTSGDPTDTSVMIWTALPVDPADTAHLVSWQLATDSTFSAVLQSGTLLIGGYTSYTGKVDIQGLRPYTKYCYRFRADGAYSVTGFTQTAPDNAPDSLQFALMSCSSLYSGYFNAYRQVARNASINAIIHVGDFIYDFIDPQERIRIPQPEPQQPVTLDDWRDRYRLYLLDPDFREARRMHPWIQIWDNHELHGGHFGICSKAFFEFSPVRRPSATDSTQIWRKLSYGQMADIFMTDDWQYADRDTFADGGKKMMLDPQTHWLLDGLDSSHAVWKIIAVSKLFSPWNLGGLNLPGGGLDDSWDGYPESRDSLLANIARRHINNPVFVSGDLHMNIVSDIALNPFDSTAYDRATGAGGIGVEVNGISISRGNVDESGISPSAGPGLIQASFGLNPQQQYLNLFDNGYALLTLNNDSLISRMQLCPILMLSDTQITDRVLYCRANDNHWLRTATPTAVRGSDTFLPFSVYPNPSTGQWMFTTRSNLTGSQIEVTNAEGQLIYKNNVSRNETKINISGPAGLYFLRVSAPGGTYITKLVKM